MFLAAAPTGVSQAAAAVIQLALAAFGASGMVQAGVEAADHGAAWLTIAWTAHGKPDRITEASKEFLRMLIAVAVTALSYVGAKGNFSNAVKIANKLPAHGMPAFATAGVPLSEGARAATSTAIGPSAGGFAVAGSQMVKHQGEGGNEDHGAAADSEKPAAARHDDEQASRHPSKDGAEAHGPAKLTGPSGKPDPHVSPTGRRARPSAADKDPVNIRALEQENESADVLARQGYQVEQNPKVSGPKKPDSELRGRSSITMRQRPRIRDRSGHTSGRK